MNVETLALVCWNGFFCSLNLSKLTSESSLWCDSLLWCSRVPLWDQRQPGPGMCWRFFWFRAAHRLHGGLICSFVMNQYCAKCWLQYLGAQCNQTINGCTAEWHPSDCCFTASLLSVFMLLAGAKMCTDLGPLALRLCNHLLYVLLYTFSFGQGWRRWLQVIQPCKRQTQAGFKNIFGLVIVSDNVLCQSTCVY